MAAATVASKSLRESMSMRSVMRSKTLKALLGVGEVESDSDILPKIPYKDVHTNFDISLEVRLNGVRIRLKSLVIIVFANHRMFSNICKCFNIVLGRSGKGEG